MKESYRKVRGESERELQEGVGRVTERTEEGLRESYRKGRGGSEGELQKGERRD